MKVKFLVLFLCIEGYSAMAASATIATDCELPKATVSNAAGGGGASSGSPVGDLVDSKELNAHVLIEAQRHFPEDYVSVVYAEKHKSSNISPLFNRLSSLWHGAVRVTLKSMEKELYLYLNSTGQCTVLLEADPDTMHCKSHSLNAPVNQEDGKAGAFTQMEARVRFTTLEGVCRYVKYIMRTEIDTAESDYRFSYRYDDLLPVLDKSIEVSHVTTEYLNGSEYTLIEGCNKTKHVQVCYISKLGEVPRIVYEATDDINVLFLTQGGFLYCCQVFPGNIATITLFEPETGKWKPTNIENVPTMLTSINDLDFAAHPTAPDKILYLRQPRDGLNDWTFFDAEYQGLFAEKMALIRKDWSDKGYPFKEAPINFHALQEFFLEGHRMSRNFNFPFGPMGHISINKGGVVETMIDNNPDLHAFRPQPYTFQRHAVGAEDGYALPYYTIDGMREGHAKPRPALWWIQGGPHVEFGQDEDLLMDWFLRHNFLVIIPRERIRTELGYDHYKAGVGQLHERSLLDAIEPINDLIAKGIVDPTQVIGYGMSYGGYAMASFATRWGEFARKARFKPLGLIAEAAFLTLDATLESAGLFAPKGVFTEGSPGYSTFLQSFFPLYKSALELSLFMTHGIYDHRCPIAVARTFYEKFKDNPLLRMYMEHPKPHDSIVDEENELGVRIVQNMVSSMLPDMMTPARISGRELANAGIEVKKGAAILHIIPDAVPIIPSHDLHLFGF